MNLPRKTLLDALKLVAPATKRGQLPVTHCVRIGDNDGAVNITATDLDLTISVTLDTNAIQAPIVAPHAPLQAFVSSAGDDIDLDTEDDLLTVSAGSSTLRLRTMPRDDYPAVRHAEGDLIAVSAEHAQQLGQCLYAASRDQARPVLCGIGIIDGWVVATDSYRLSAVQLDAGLPNRIIPAHVIEQALKNTDTGFSLAVDDIRATFYAGATTWTSRLIEGQFPNWQRLVVAPTGRMRCEKADLLGALDQVDIFGASYVKVTSDKNGIRLATRSDNGDEVAAVIPGEISDDIAFTLRYLADIAKTVDGDIFDLGLDGTTKPAVIGSLESGRVDLLMPVRVS